MKEISQALLFRVGDSVYAINSDEVTQILRVPDITAIPFCDESISGLCHIEGVVLPVFDIERLIFGDGCKVDVRCDKSRLLTIKNGHSRFALLVKEVYSNIDTSSGQVRFSDERERSSILGIIRYKEQIIQIVDTERLTASIRKIELQKRDVSDGARSMSVHQKVDVPLQKYLFFTLGDESFAINSELVREIIVPGLEITHIADAPKELLGVVTLRDEIIGVVEFAQVFEKKRQGGEQNRIIIVQNGLGTAGLYVDCIIDIRDIAESDLEPLPTIYNHGKFKGIFILEGRIVSIIDDKIVNAQIEKTVAHGVREPKNVQINAMQGSEQQEVVETVMFMVGGNEYAFCMSSVQEIIRYTEITPLPGSPDHLLGMINLRGRVIPVLSLHKRLGASENISDETKILVCSFREQSIGFLVDGISEVRDVPKANIKSADASDEILDGTIMLEGKIVQKLSIDGYLGSGSLSFKGFLDG